MSNKFYVEISEALKKELDLAKKTVEEEAEEVGEETVVLLKDISPKGARKGKYARAWRKTVDSKGIVTVHLGGREYRLSHLLEKGHQIIYKGKSVGRAKAIPHIEVAEQKAIVNFEKKVIRRLENG